MKIDGYTRLAAVVANPIKHSISLLSIMQRLSKRALLEFMAWEISQDDFESNC